MIIFFKLIQAVKFMSSRSQLISFSADKILRIWNVPLQICIQRVANVFPKGPEGNLDYFIKFLKIKQIH